MPSPGAKPWICGRVLRTGARPSGRVDSPWTTRQARVAHRLTTLAGLSPTTPPLRQRVFFIPGRRRTQSQKGSFPIGFRQLRACTTPPSPPKCTHPQQAPTGGRLTSTPPPFRLVFSLENAIAQLPYSREECFHRWYVRGRNSWKGAGVLACVPVPTGLLESTSHQNDKPTRPARRQAVHARSEAMITGFPAREFDWFAGSAVGRSRKKRRRGDRPLGFCLRGQGRKGRENRATPVSPTGAKNQPWSEAGHCTNFDTRIKEKFPDFSLLFVSDHYDRA